MNDKSLLYESEGAMVVDVKEETLKQINRFLRHFFYILLGFLNAYQIDICHLIVFLVTTHGLSESFGIACNVKNIVNYLKGKSDIFAIFFVLILFPSKVISPSNV